MFFSCDYFSKPHLESNLLTLSWILDPKKEDTKARDIQQRHSVPSAFLITVSTCRPQLAKQLLLIFNAFPSQFSRELCFGLWKFLRISHSKYSICIGKSHLVHPVSCLLNISILWRCFSEQPVPVPHHPMSNRNTY